VRLNLYRRLADLADEPEIAAFGAEMVDRFGPSPPEVRHLLDTVVIKTRHGRETLKNDFVFAMTGYHPDFTFLELLGIRFKGPDRTPVCNPETLESNVPGIYLAGVIVAGERTNEIFIENGRFHGRQIAVALTSK